MFASGEDSSLAFGVLAANADNPAVVHVEVSPTPVQSLAVTFTDDVNAAALIDDGTMVSAVTLVNLASGPVSVQASQFAYDPAARKLTLSLAQPLASGAYELRIEGSKIQNPAGKFLPRRTGRTELPNPLVRRAHSNSGCRSRSEGGWVLGALAGGLEQRWPGRLDRRRENGGGNRQGACLFELGDQYGSRLRIVWVCPGRAGDLSVPASGCLGVFPRVFDWNQDGKQDLVWGLADGTIQVTLNESTAAEPRFGTPLVVQVGPPEGKTTCDVGERATFAIVDWNNDGRSDLVLGGLDGKVHVLLNEAAAGSPDFRSDTIVLDGANPLTASSGRSSVVVVDLNDDGRKDLVLGNTEGQLVYYTNVGTDASPQFNGSQLLQADGAVIDLSGIPRSRPYVADVNGDGVPDLLVGAADGLVRQYLGSRTGGARGGRG